MHTASPTCTHTSKHTSKHTRTHVHPTQEAKRAYKEEQDALEAQLQLQQEASMQGLIEVRGSGGSVYHHGQEGQYIMPLWQQKQQQLELMQGHSSVLEQKELQEQLERERAALTEQTDTLGPEHPDTLTTMSRLANILFQQGQHASAAEMQQQTIEMRHRVLGVEHPDTLSSMANLAYSLLKLGQADAAVEIEQQVLMLRRKVQGPEHPDTIMSMGNLALSLSAAGHHEAAAALQAKVAELQAKQLEGQAILEQGLAQQQQMVDGQGAELLGAEEQRELQALLEEQARWEQEEQGKMKESSEGQGEQEDKPDWQAQAEGKWKEEKEKQLAHECNTARLKVCVAPHTVFATMCVSSHACVNC